MYSVYGNHTQNGRPTQEIIDDNRKRTRQFTRPSNTITFREVFRSRYPSVERTIPNNGELCGTAGETYEYYRSNASVFKAGKIIEGIQGRPDSPS